MASQLNRHGNCRHRGAAGDSQHGRRPGLWQAEARERVRARAGRRTPRWASWVGRGWRTGARPAGAALWRCPRAPARPAVASASGTRDRVRQVHGAARRRACCSQGRPPPGSRAARCAGSRLPCPRRAQKHARRPRRSGGCAGAGRRTTRVSSSPKMQPSDQRSMADVYPPRDITTCVATCAVQG